MHEQLSDYVVPMLAGLVFIAVMSRIRDTVRLPLNAVLVVGASGVYMSGGLGMWVWLKVANRRPDQTGSYRSALAEELIVPRKAQESLLWKRMQGRRFMKRRMPPIATELIDPQAAS